MVRDFFENKIKYNNHVKFINIEKELIKKIYNIENQQLEYEIKNYDKTNMVNKQTYNVMVEEIFNLLNDTSNFSKEEKTIINFINLNDGLLEKLEKKTCNISYISQLFTN
jgi:hypothetical protein